MGTCKNYFHKLLQFKNLADCCQIKELKMGKAKKLKISKAPRNSPLEEHIQKDEFAVPTGRVKQRNDRKDEATSEEYVNEKLSKQILTQARLQMQDLQRESDGGSSEVSKKLPKLGDNMDSDEEDDVEDEIGASEADDYDKSFSNDIKKDYNINKKDEQAFERFMNKSTGPRRTLAEILQEKITEKRTEVDTMYSDVDSLQQRDLDPRVVEMYQSVGKILSKYRSGKVPKAFKVIAQFRNWEDL